MQINIEIQKSTNLTVARWLLLPKIISLNIFFEKTTKSFSTDPVSTVTIFGTVGI
jgi:hypothetical protein